mmetsp:Transcript_9694/g.20023  ORF Transcript_9694/g.20023 Transcript_9694/m.20023 type:complete len:204 (+) Transcript_9694:2-613(+)
MRPQPALPPRRRPPLQRRRAARALPPLAAALAAVCGGLCTAARLGWGVGFAVGRGSTAGGARPNFTGVWRVERTENLGGFMQDIDYNFLIAKAAGLARVTQTIEHQGDELDFTFEVMPPILSSRRQSLVRVGEQEIPMTDDAGREMILLNPTWNATVFTAGLQYVNPRHDLTIDRYLEDGCMVEHVRYPNKGVEMRRIFQKVS